MRWTYHKTEATREQSVPINGVCIAGCQYAEWALVDVQTMVYNLVQHALSEGKTRCFCTAAGRGRSTGTGGCAGRLGLRLQLQSPGCAGLCGHQRSAAGGSGLGRLWAQPGRQLSQPHASGSQRSATCPRWPAASQPELLRPAWPQGPPTPKGQAFQQHYLRHSGL